MLCALESVAVVTQLCHRVRNCISQESQQDVPKQSVRIAMQGWKGLLSVVSGDSQVKVLSAVHISEIQPHAPADNSSAIHSASEL